MNVSVGKFFSKMFNRKQNAPKKITTKITPKDKDKYVPPKKWRSLKWIGKHNAHQAMRAKKRLKNRKKTRMQKSNRNINRRGGKS